MIVNFKGLILERKITESEYFKIESWVIKQFRLNRNFILEVQDDNLNVYFQDEGYIEIFISDGYHNTIKKIKKINNFIVLQNKKDNDFDELIESIRENSKARENM